MTAGAGGDGYEGRVLALGCRFQSIPIAKRALNPAADLRLLWSMYRLYKAEKPDVVHHHTIKPVIYGSVAARMADVPRVINTVTGLGYAFTGSAVKWLTKLVEVEYKIALKSSHRTLFMNQADMDLFLERHLVDPNRIELIQPGVDTVRFKPRKDRRSNGKLRVLMVSRLLGDKGVYEFVQSAEQLRSRHKNVGFYILGARDERNPTVVPLTDVERWKSERVVEWLGQVEDVRDELSRADIVVLPSYREGTSRSLLEASAMGKPLIASNVPGCREVVEDGLNGFLVAPKSSSELTEAIDCLLQNQKLRDDMGDASRVRAIEQFDERRTNARLLELYTAETV
jgi:glycosyltransferase involved in cell wall biosynthesis